MGCEGWKEGVEQRWLELLVLGAVEEERDNRVPSRRNGMKLGVAERPRVGVGGGGAGAGARAGSWEGRHRMGGI